jgi:tripeptidyl-peptidase-1
MSGSTSSYTARSTSAALVLHEARPDIPKGWASLGPSNNTTPMNLRVALKSADVSGLQQSLLAVSTPGNAKYGRHLTAAEVSARSQCLQRGCSRA